MWFYPLKFTPSNVRSFPVRKALITGASSGLGAAMAGELAKNDYKLILIGRNAERLGKVCNEIGSSAQPVICDLSSPLDIASLVKSLKGGSLDVLINNAGVVSHSPFEETPDEEWTRQWVVNMMGPVRLTRSLFPQLKKAPSSRVINISSTAALRPVPGLSSYSAVKAAMIMWTKSLAQEWAKYKIRVNCICPGIVNTPIQSFHGLPEDQLRDIHHRHPLGRMGQPEDIAKMTKNLVAADWVTGSIITIDGGLTLV